LEQLREEVVVEERQVVCLGMRELCIKMAGLGLHNREVFSPIRQARLISMMAAQ